MMVSVLFCLFAIITSAEVFTYEGQEMELVNDLGDPSWYTGTTASKIQDKESVVILKDADGNMTAYPSYYVFRYLIDSSGVRIAWASDKGVDYSFVNEKTGKNYTSGSIYYVELPYGITTCNAYNVWGKGKAEPNVVEFVIPDSVTVIYNNAFAEINNCKKVTMSKNLVTLDEWSFYNSKDLETVIFPKDSALQTIAKGSFSGCSSLSSINLENCQSLKTLGDSAFNSCTAIDKLYLPDSLKTIGMQAIYNLGELELASNYLPKSLTYVGEYFLSDCQVSNDVLYFPEGFTSFNSKYCFIGTYAPKTSLTLVFLGKMTSVNLVNTDLSKIISSGTKQPLRVIFAQNQFSDIKGAVVPLVDFNGQNGFITKYANGASPYVNQEGTLTVTFDEWSTWNGTHLGTDASGNTVYLADSATEMIFCGGDTVEISYSVRLNHTDKGWYRFHTTTKAYDMNAHTNGGVHYNNYVYQPGNCGYDETTTNTCVICELQSIVIGEKATGEHKYTDDFNCETALDCEICKKTLSEALTHDVKAIITYENGYMELGSRAVICQNEGCNHESNTDAQALFVCLGYSSPQNGREEMVIGFTVNNEAVSEYVSATGNVLRYGVFATLEENIGKSDIFNSNGEVANGVISADTSSHGFVAFELKILGFTDEYKDTALAMGAYVATTDEDGTEYSYMQAGEPNDGEKYYFASFNDVAKLFSAK